MTETRVIAFPFTGVQFHTQTKHSNHFLPSVLSYDALFHAIIYHIPNNEDDHFSMTANDHYTTLLKIYSLKTTDWEI